MKKKPRDPFVQHLIKKKQGAHVKSKKAIRSQEKAQLKKSVDSSDKLIIGYLL